MASAYRSRFFLILIAVIVLPALSLLKAQSSRGAILGTVRDPAGALVPGAKVSVANQATNTSFEYETDTTGNYYVPSLIPGRYRIAVEKAGFKKFTANDVIVEVDQAVRVDIRMELGQVTEVVEVREAAPMAQTDTTTLGQVVRDRQVLELPLNGRDFQNLISSTWASRKCRGHYHRHSPPRSKRQLPQLQRERLTAGVPELSH